MSHQDLSLHKGKMFESFQALDTFISQYQVQKKERYSVHKSKTIQAANVQKKIKENLVYYSLHYTCHRSGTYKSKGKGLRKTKSIKTNCPAFIKIKVTKNGDYLEVDGFDENHNHLPLDVLTEGQFEPGYCDDSADEKDKTLGSSDNIFQVKIPEPESGQESEDACLDIASLSIYIAQDANNDHDISRIDLNAEQFDVTLPNLSIAQIPSNLEFVKVKVSNASGHVRCASGSEVHKSDTSDFQVASTEASTITSEELHFETDLAEILDASELLANDKEEISASVFENKAQIKSKRETSLDEENPSVLTIPKAALDRCHEPIVYSVSKTKASSIVTTDPTNATLDIDMPPITRSRGRPRGAALTAIGLPKRTNRAIEFMHKTPEAKAKTILGWLIPEVMQDNVLRGEYEITKKDIEHLTAETLTDAVVDDLVDLTIVEQHFDKRAFSHLVKLVSRKHKSNTFTCGVCNKLVERDCILCNCCLLWHHFSCVKLKRAPKTASWFCAGCTGTR